jgi:lysozyme family protein
MSLVYDMAFREVIGIEGGYTDNPEDNGNWTGGKKGLGDLKGTKYGISAASFPDLDIRSLTVEDVKSIYYKRFWKPLRCDEIVGPEIAVELFEQSVNVGLRVGAINLQKALIYFFREDIGEIDGVIGQRTLDACNKWCRKDPDALFRALNGYQFRWYATILENNPGQRIFSRSWLNRVQFYNRQLGIGG